MFHFRAKGYEGGYANAQLVLDSWVKVRIGNTLGEFGKPTDKRVAIIHVMPRGRKDSLKFNYMYKSDNAAFVALVYDVVTHQHELMEKGTSASEEVRKLVEAALVYTIQNMDQVEMFEMLNGFNYFAWGEGNTSARNDIKVALGIQ